MNCHSGWAPQQIAEMGWEEFNATPYFDTVEKLRERHGDGTEGAELGSAARGPAPVKRARDFPAVRESLLASSVPTYGCRAIRTGGAHPLLTEDSVNLLPFKSL